MEKQAPGPPPADGDGPRCRPDQQATFGRNFEAARVLKNLSQHEVARLTGTPQPYISNLERGLKNPTLRTMERLARAVGSDLRTLLKP